MKVYEITLRRVLRHPLLTLLVTLSTIGVTAYLYVVIPKGFFPQQDTGRLTGSIEADQDISFQAMRQFLHRFAATVSNDPAVSGVVAFMGGSFGGAANSARMFIALKPRDEGGDTAEAVMARMRKQTSQIAGATLRLQPVQDVRIGGRPSSAQYQFTMYGDDLAELNEWGGKVLRELRKLPGIVDVTTDQQNRGLQAALEIDRLAAARLGITTRMIDDALYDAFGQRIVSTMYKSLNQYHVVIVLGVLYESYIHPITIISTLPSAGVGGLLALLICSSELNLMAVIGFLLLIGVVKNAIMKIDFALEAERGEGKSPEAAIFEACLLRFRPITMTTMAALFGSLPLALGTGAGAELRRPLGIAVVGGLIVSQVLTLYTTPVVYLYLDRLRLWWNNWWSKRSGSRSLANTI